MNNLKDISKPINANNHHSKPLKTRILGVALLSSVTLGAIGISSNLTANETQTAASSVVAPVVLQADFSNLVANVTPSVVRVNVSQEVSGKQNVQQIPEIWQRFFEMPKQKSRIKQGTGSGFFIGDGYVLTNHHVIDGADKITLTLNDRREIDVELVGSDKRTDVAVLKVLSKDDYQAVTIGRSKTVRVGEPVLAIGSPFGFDYSASAGIVSATSRNLSREDTVPFIQTDVALNPGNSGGPLFNQYGHVIGINSRIFSGTGGYMGLSFSIPIDLAMDVADQIKDTGSVTRAYLGVYPQDIDRNLAEVYKLDKPTGALITQVEPNSGASKAGIKTGDLILAYNGHIVDRASELINKIARARVNDNFSVTVLRNGRKQQLKGKLGLAPDNMDTSNNKTIKAKKNSQTQLGISIRALTEREKYRLGNVSGVLIGDVNPTGISGRAGMKPGDVITGLNGKKVTGMKSFAKAVNSLPKTGAVEVRVNRRGTPRIMGMRLK